MQALDMSDNPPVVQGATGHYQESLKWKQCILCQSNSREVVQHPQVDSYQRLLDVVQERASLHDGIYVEIHKRLQGCTKRTLCTHNAVYHHS